MCLCLLSYFRKAKYLIFEKLFINHVEMSILKKLKSLQYLIH